MTGTTGEKEDEDYFEWKFSAYARLWNSLRETLGSIDWIGPELYDLWWWDGYEYEAWIGAPDSLYYDPFVQPEIRVFKADGSDYPYLFYVNRQCRQATTRVEIRIDEDSVPDADLDRYALDHSRR